MSSLFSSGLFGHLTGAAADTVTARLIELSASLTFSDGQRSEWKQALEFHGLPARAPAGRIPLDQVRRECRRHIREYPLAALLATTWPKAERESESFNRLAAWTVVTSLVLMARDDDHRSKVETACAAVRLIAEKRETAAMEKFVGRTDSLPIAFQAALHAEFIGSAHANAIRFAPIRVLFESYLEDKSPIVRRGEEGDTDDIYYVTRTAPIPDIDLPDEIGGSADQGITTAYLRSERDQHNPEHQLHRLEADFPAIGDAREIRSLPLQAYRRTTLLHDSLRRRLALPCQYGSMTRHEIGAIMAATESFIDGARRQRWREHLVIVTGLIAGLDPRDILKLPRAKIDPPKDVKVWFLIMGNDVVLCRAAGLKAPHMSDRARRLLGEGPDYLRIGLPHQISVALLRLWADSTRTAPTTAEIESAFEELTAHIGRKQTIRRMTSVLRDGLVRSGTDPVIAAHIAGDSSRNVAGLYYATIDNASIEQAFRSVVGKISGARFHWPEMLQHPVGSELNVQARMIRSFFKHAQTELDRLPRIEPRDIVLFHNRYITLVTVALMLMTGHRPVKQPFERLTDFDRRRGLLYISDKELRISASGRFVPVPAAFSLQIDMLLAHLRFVATDALIAPGSVRAVCRDAMNGEGPMLFYLSAHNGDDEVVAQPVAPKELAAQLARNIWPLPLNWGRHVQRSLLQRVSGDLADAFMGHADPGAEAMARHSGFSQADLEDLRTALTDICEELGVVPLRGLG